MVVSGAFGSESFSSGLEDLGWEEEELEEEVGGSEVVVFVLACGGEGEEGERSVASDEKD